MSKISINPEHFGTNLGLTGGKYMMKIIFDIKIGVGIFDMSNVSNFKTFWALLIWVKIWA